jgi:hypothetical protein
MSIVCRLKKLTLLKKFKEIISYTVYYVNMVKKINNKILLLKSMGWSLKV